MSKRPMPAPVSPASLRGRTRPGRALFSHDEAREFEQFVARVRAEAADAPRPAFGTHILTDASRILGGLPDEREADEILAELEEWKSACAEA